MNNNLRFIDTVTGTHVFRKHSPGSTFDVKSHLPVSTEATNAAIKAFVNNKPAAPGTESSSAPQQGGLLTVADREAAEAVIALITLGIRKEINDEEKNKGDQKADQKDLEKRITAAVNKKLESEIVTRTNRLTVLWKEKNPSQKFNELLNATSTQAQWRVLLRETLPKAYNISNTATGVDQKQGANDQKENAFKDACENLLKHMNAQYLNTVVENDLSTVMDLKTDRDLNPSHINTRFQNQVALIKNDDGSTTVRYKHDMNITDIKSLMRLREMSKRRQGRGNEIAVLDATDIKNYRTPPDHMMNLGIAKLQLGLPARFETTVNPMELGLNSFSELSIIDNFLKHDLLFRKSGRYTQPLIDFETGEPNAAMIQMRTDMYQTLMLRRQLWNARIGGFLRNRPTQWKEGAHDNDPDVFLNKVCTPQMRRAIFLEIQKRSDARKAASPSRPNLVFVEKEDTVGDRKERYWLPMQDEDQRRVNEGGLESDEKSSEKQRNSVEEIPYVTMGQALSLLNPEGLKEDMKTLSAEQVLLYYKAAADEDAKEANSRLSQMKPGSGVGITDLIGKEMGKLTGLSDSCQAKILKALTSDQIGELIGSCSLCQQIDILKNLAKPKSSFLRGWKSEVHFKAALLAIKDETAASVIRNITDISGMQEMMADSSLAATPIHKAWRLF